MNPPDVSTPETENPPEPRAASRTAWRLGPIACSVIGLLMLVEFIQGYVWTSNTQNHDAVRFGLRFGIVGGLAVWSTSSKVQRRYVATLSALAGAALMALYDTAWDRYENLHEAGPMMLLFIAYAAIVMAGIHTMRLAGRSIRGPHHKTQQTSVPSFSVGHLLVTMLVVAVLAMIFRWALPDISRFLDLATLIIVLSWATAGIAAGVLLLDQRPTFWRIGLFAAIGLAAGYFGGWLSDWEVTAYSEVIQMVVLVLMIVGPQLDQYAINITFEPRDVTKAPPSDQLTE